MQAVKQQAIARINQLPDNAGMAEIIAALEQMKPYAPTQPPPHPLDECFGALGLGRRTDAVIAELRDGP